MEDLQKITVVVRKTRSVSSIVNRTLKFLSAESKTLIKLLIVYSLPFLTVGFLISYFISYGPPGLETLYYSKESSIKNFFLYILISFLIYITGLCSSTLLVNMLIKAREVDNESILIPTEKISFHMIREHLKTYWLNFLIIYLLYSGSNWLIHQAEQYNFLADSAASPDILSYIVDVFISYLPQFILLPPVMFLGLTSLYVSMRNDLGSIEAINYVLKVTREKLGKMYWGSFMICLIALFSKILLAYAFQYLGFFLGFAGLHSSAIIYVILLKNLSNLALLLFAQAASIFLLGSLEDELEGHYMRSKIDQI